MRRPSRNSAVGGAARASSPTAHTITPHLVVGGAAQAADWYQQAFGAQPGARIPLPGGKFIQIEVRLGDATVMLADEFPYLGGTYGALDIATEDAPQRPQIDATGRGGANL